MSLFLDTSGLLGCFTDQGPATRALQRAWRAEECVAISAQADLEFMHEVRQLQVMGADHDACMRIAAQYQMASADFVRRRTDPLYIQGALLGIRHALPPGPSMHLAVAMDFREQILRQAPDLQDPVGFGTLNPDLARAAKAEGFRTVP